MAKSNNDDVMGLLSHLLGIFTGFVGPLIMFIILKDKGGKPFAHAKEALNFQLSLVIYYVVATILIFGLFGILYFALYVFSLIVMILAAMKSYNGEMYQYPLCIRFLK